MKLEIYLDELNYFFDCILDGSDEDAAQKFMEASLSTLSFMTNYVSLSKRILTKYVELVEDGVAELDEDYELVNEVLERDPQLIWELPVG